MTRTPLTRDFLDRRVPEAAPDLLGPAPVRTTDGSTVELRPVELRLTEAHAGEAGPGSHAYRGRTARSSVVSRPPGHSYACATHGMSRRSA
ncbi:DNA-3-methyladenine glycosylase [Streptomyces sp. NPDC102402]|uniref:DNA-3-methyladenine glycosylase n=1 Tax=Streptomyces sp. NPDC102402 TaxID=3366169 RepID=UPI0037FE226C